MSAAMNTKCMGRSESELFALATTLLPTGHRLRSKILKHFSRSVIDHPNHRVAKSFKTADSEVVLSIFGEVFIKRLIDLLESDESTEMVHKELATYYSVTKACASLVPVFELDVGAKEYLHLFAAQCGDTLKRRISAVEEDQLDEEGRTKENNNGSDARAPRSPALTSLLSTIDQQDVYSWKEGLPSDAVVEVAKLGEGQYGEVFRTRFEGQAVALKVVPFLEQGLGYPGKVNGDLLKDVALVLPELLVTSELSRLSEGTSNKTTTFIRLVGARVVKGSYPVAFLDAWDEFKEANGSENDRPDQYAVHNQLFLCIALELGGQDLESFQIEGEEQAISILAQAIWALRVAEEEISFEHRDLHAGNLLIQPTDEESIRYHLKGKAFDVRTAGIAVKLIDYSLSRMEKDGATRFFDLESDPDLFRGTASEYQFEIYRLMREATQNNWSTFCPKTNALWVHFLSRHLLTRKFAERTPVKTRKGLQAVFDKLLEYDSLGQFVANCVDFERKVLRRFLSEVTEPQRTD